MTLEISTKDIFVLGVKTLHVDMRLSKKGLIVILIVTFSAAAGYFMHFRFQSQNHKSNESTAVISHDNKPEIINHDGLVEASPLQQVPTSSIHESVKIVSKGPEMDAPIRKLYDHSRNFVFDHDWTRVLAVGDIYKNGCYPHYSPDEDIALEIYQLCARCPDGEVAGLGQARYVETRLHPVVNDDRGYRPLPRDPAYMVCAEGREVIKRTPLHTFGVPVGKRIEGLRTSVQFHGDSRENRLPSARRRVAIRLNAENDHFAPPPGFSVEQDAPDITAYMTDVFNAGHHRSDAQNTHDHGVTTAIKSAIDQLRSRHGSPDVRQCESSMNRVRNSILESDESPEDKMKAMEVLDNIKAFGHSTYGMSEAQVLALADMELSKKGSDERQNGRESLVKQLATGVENGNVVCSSGKIGRIISTFDGTDTFDKLIKPMWAVREEMGSLATKIRDEHGDGTTGLRKFEQEARRIYINDLGMSDKIVSPIIEQYALGFDV